MIRLQHLVLYWGRFLRRRGGSSVFQISGLPVPVLRKERSPPMKRPKPSSSEVSSLGSRRRRPWRKIWPRDAPPGGGPKPVGALFSKLEGTPSPPPPPQRSSSSFLENFSAVRSEEKSGKANPSSWLAEGRHLADGYLQKVRFSLLLFFCSSFFPAYRDAFNTVLHPLSF